MLMSHPLLIEFRLTAAGARRIAIERGHTEASIPLASRPHVDLRVAVGTGDGRGLLTYQRFERFGEPVWMRTVDECTTDSDGVSANAMTFCGLRLTEQVIIGLAFRRLLPLSGVALQEGKTESPREHYNTFTRVHLGDI